MGGMCEEPGSGIWSSIDIYLCYTDREVVIAIERIRMCNSDNRQTNQCRDDMPPAVITGMFECNGKKPFGLRITYPCKPVSFRNGERHLLKCNLCWNLKHAGYHNWNSRVIEIFGFLFCLSLDRKLYVNTFSELLNLLYSVFSLRRKRKKVIKSKININL